MEEGKVGRIRQKKANKNFMARKPIAHIRKRYAHRLIRAFLDGIMASFTDITRVLGRGSHDSQIPSFFLDYIGRHWILNLAGMNTLLHRDSDPTVRNVFLEPAFAYPFTIHRPLSHPSNMTPLSSCPDDLEDVRLDDNAHAEQQNRSTRPGCLHGPIHEILLVVVAASIGATFLVLQRGTIVITDSIKQSLSMDAPGTSWITASSGWVPVNPFEC